MSELDPIEQSKLRLNRVSSSFCLAKWNQSTLHLFNGQTRSCHHVESHKVDLKKLKESPGVLHNTLRKQEYRQQMLKGERPKECEYCWKLEDTQGFSDRYYKSNENWALEDFDEISRSQKFWQKPPRYLEVAFDNLCNLKCMYCGPSYSSSWQKEIENFGPYPTTGSYNNLMVARWKGLLPLRKKVQEELLSGFWNWWPEVEYYLMHLRVTGGEPLLSKETWKLLETLQSSFHPRLHFSLNSNLSVPTTQIERLINSINRIGNRVKSFNLYTSIDTRGPQAEYIRFGLKEKSYWENVDKILLESKSPIHLSFTITLNCLSLFGLKSLLEKIAQLRAQHSERHSIGMDTPYLKNPQHLSLQILPSSYSCYLDDSLNFMERSASFAPDECKRLERMRNLMQKNNWSSRKIRWMRRDFFKMFSEYDKRRNVNFCETFPELSKFWKDCEGIARRWPLSLL